MIRRSSLVALSAPLFLAACLSSNDCTGDPRLDGLAAAAGCTFGGGYQAETDRLAAEASQKTQLANALRSENNSLKEQMASLDERERVLASRLIGVNDEIAALERRLSDRLEQQEIGAAEYELGLAQLNDVSAQSSSVQPTDPQAEARIAELEAEIAELKRFLG